MCGHNDRGAMLAGIGKKFEQGFLASGIETNEWFIHQQKIKGANETESNCSFLFETTTESIGHVVSTLIQTKMTEKICSRLLPLFNTVQASNVFKVLPQSEVIVKRWLVSNEAQ